MSSCHWYVKLTRNKNSLDGLKLVSNLSINVYSWGSNCMVLVLLFVKTMICHVSCRTSNSWYVCISWCRPILWGKLKSFDQWNLKFPLLDLLTSVLRFKVLISKTSKHWNRDRGFTDWVLSKSYLHLLTSSRKLFITIRMSIWQFVTLENFLTIWLYLVTVKRVFKLRY